jgi:hypothetical protein
MRFDSLNLKQLRAEENTLSDKVYKIQNRLDAEQLPLEEEAALRESYWHYFEQLREVQDCIDDLLESEEEK